MGPYFGDGNKTINTSLSRLTCYSLIQERASQWLASSRHQKVQRGSVSFFRYFSKDRLPTADNLAVKNWPHMQTCILCGEHILEASSHLFIHCSYAMTIWYNLVNNLSLHSDPINYWLSLRRRQDPSTDHATIWNIQKEKNRRIFQGAIMPPCALLEIIFRDINK